MKTRELHKIEVGQIWLDRDPRMSSGHRRVKVIAVDVDHVTYSAWPGETRRTNRSRYRRFQYDFELVQSSGQ